MCFKVFTCAFSQREQEWNISRKELMELVKLGLLSEEEIEQITAIKFNPVTSWNSLLPLPI